MCAINPRFKKRIIFDFYTSVLGLTEEQFTELVFQLSLTAELHMNKSGLIRVHVKETDQQAE